MGGLGVVAVDAVLHQQLPVRGEAVLVGAPGHLDIAAAPVDHQVDVVLGAGEIGGQVDDLGIEAGEDEAAVGLDTRYPLEPQLVEVQPARVGVAVRHALELPSESNVHAW